MKLKIFYILFLYNIVVSECLKTKKSDDTDKPGLWSRFKNVFKSNPKKVVQDKKTNCAFVDHKDAYVTEIYGKFPYNKINTMEADVQVHAIFISRGHIILRSTAKHPQSIYPVTPITMVFSMKIPVCTYTLSLIVSHVLGLHYLHEEKPTQINLTQDTLEKYINTFDDWSDSKKSNVYKKLKKVSDRRGSYLSGSLMYGWGDPLYRISNIHMHSHGKKLPVKIDKENFYKIIIDIVILAMRQPDNIFEEKRYMNACFNVHHVFATYRVKQIKLHYGGPICWIRENSQVDVNLPEFAHKNHMRHPKLNCTRDESKKQSANDTAEEKDLRIYGFTEWYYNVLIQALYYFVKKIKIEVDSKTYDVIEPMKKLKCVTGQHKIKIPSSLKPKEGISKYNRILNVMETSSCTDWQKCYDDFQDLLAEE